MQGETDTQSHEQAFLIPVRPYEQDEVSLADLWLVLKRRMVTVLITFTVVIIAALAIVFSLKPVYSSKAVVQIGKVSGQPVETVDIIISWLTGIYTTDGASRQSVFLSSVEKAKRLNSDLVTLETNGMQAEQTQKYLMTIVQSLLDKYQPIYEDALEGQQSRLASLTESIADIRSQIAILDASVDKLPHDDVSQSIIIEIEKSSLFGDIASLEKERADLVLALSSINTRQSAVVKEPTLNNTPIKPRLRVLILLSLVLSIIVSIFAAFVIEFFQKPQFEVRKSNFV